MMHYTIHKTAPVPLEAVDFALAEEGRVSYVRPESSAHHPETRFRVLHDGVALYLQFRVEDAHVRSVQTEYQGPVYTDSCVEFFVQPVTGKGYFNFEINAGGTLLLTNTAVDDNAQQIAGRSEAFKLAAGKTLWFEARVKISDATESDLIVGLVADGEDMTGVADNRFADGIGFFKADGATALQFGASKDGTDTGANTNVGTVTTGWHVIGFRVDGLTSATPYFDGVAGTPISATFCDDEALCPIAMVRNGAAAAKTLEVDYVKVVQLR